LHDKISRKSQPGEEWEISGKALDRYFELHGALMEFSAQADAGAQHG